MVWNHVLELFFKSLDRQMPVQAVARKTYTGLPEGNVYKMFSERGHNGVGDVVGAVLGYLPGSCASALMIGGDREKFVPGGSKREEPAPESKHPPAQ
ncbi:MAG: hypothetical protein NTW33_07735 [Methanoregula sp.]|nr:hypothetical protein [Methanoregula sp.]